MFQTIWTATHAFTEQNYTALKKASERYSYLKKVVYSICLKYVFFNLDSVPLFEKEIHVLTKLIKNEIKFEKYRRPSKFKKKNLKINMYLHEE